MLGMKTLTTLLVSLFMGSLAWAQTSIPGTIIRTAKTHDGTTKVKVYHYLNHWGNKEVRLESNALPRLGSINPTLGYGRDTTDDGKIDTFFMIDGDEGLVVKKITAKDAWGKDAIENTILKNYKSGTLAHVSAAYGAVFGFLLMSISHAWESEKEFWRELIDLEEFYLRLQSGRKGGMVTDLQWNSSLDLLHAGYDDAFKRFEKATGKDYWLLGAADVVLWVSGGVVVKYLGKGLHAVGKPLLNTPVAQQGKAALGNIISKIGTRFKNRMAKFKKIKGAPIAAVAAQSIKTQLRRTTKGLMAKNKLMHATIHTLGKTSIAFKNAILDWKYIAFMGSLQLTTEAFANYEEVRSSSPTQFAKNVLTHPDITQNVSYMTSNAFLMTAASHGIKPKGLRFATCGFIAMSNSVISNVVIRGEEDYHRMALDTGWEAIIGNTQVQIDLAALTYFEMKAVKTGNPRLRLIGWGIVLVDQAVGFVGYSKATKALEKQNQSSNLDVQLVPIMAER
jgi:hypothetical protein